MIWNGFILEVCVYFFEMIWLVGFIAATPLVPEKKTIHGNHLLLRNEILDESSWPSPSPRTCFPPPISIWKRKEEEEKRPYCPEIRVLCPRYLFRKCLSYSHKKIVKDAKEKKKKFTSPFQNVVSCGSHFFLIFPRELFLNDSDQKRKTQKFHLIILLFFIRGNFIIRSLFERKLYLLPPFCPCFTFIFLVACVLFCVSFTSWYLALCTTGVDGRVNVYSMWLDGRWLGVWTCRSFIYFSCEKTKNKLKQIDLMFLLV